MNNVVYPHIIALGPRGTFSDEAAHKVCSESSTVVYTKNFLETFKELEKNPDCVAVVPIENSVAGIVDQVQDLLVTRNLVILGEINLLVRYALLSSADLKEVTHIYVHPQAFEQTSNYTSQAFPQAQVCFTNSNTDSGVQFINALDHKQAIAAIVPLAMAETYKGYVHEKNIQDYPNNTTRFVIVRKKKAEEQFDYKLKKTSLYVELNEDHSGMLFELLNIFKQFDINLCRLESRPSKETPWAYVFFLDFHNNQHTAECLEALQASPFRQKILGCYDTLD